MIDLVMLKDFLVLCRIKSFSRAAQECHVSVSGLSRRIQTLEQWLGAPVFERHKHALELTEAGRQLQGVAQDAVRALDNLRQSIRERDEDAQRRIRFCAPHILSSVFFRTGFRACRRTSAAPSSASTAITCRNACRACATAR